MDLWTEATYDHDQQAAQRALITAKVASQPMWPFLAAANCEADFDQRLAIAGERIEAVAMGHGVARDSLEGEFRRDWSALHALAADDSDDDSSTSSGGKFYVKSDGKTVGGPYDDKAAAQAAIDGGDFEDSGSCTVSSSAADDSDGDDDGKDDEDDSSSDDSDDSDDDSGNPFAKKESKVKITTRARVNGRPYIDSGYRTTREHTSTQPRFAKAGSKQTHSVIMPDGRIFIPLGVAHPDQIRRCALEEGMDPLEYVRDMAAPGGGGGIPSEHDEGPSVGVAPESSPTLNMKPGMPRTPTA